MSGVQVRGIGMSDIEQAADDRVMHYGRYRDLTGTGLARRPRRPSPPTGLRWRSWAATQLRWPL